MLNIGLDFSVLDSRLGGRIEWYNRPGMVVYETYRTLYVTPDEETIRRLDRKNK